MKHTITVPSLILASVIAMALPTTAQPMEKQSSGTGTACTAATPKEQIALNAAKNEARQMAEVTNGGLNFYRAERAMHGAVVESPCEMIGPNSWRFTIRGGEPSAVALEEEYTILSVVTVTGLGRDRNVTIDYNGPIEEYTP
ncbi:hypothetical protein [Leptothoe sp. PORK10 BA2]|uniref:hypothetical protein n=1 Tax=Leptothoe sp. PORK10 BA2 TaxID=3110254 RepID=UPI002B20E418|nr:hypothetical protein [Leptothoe sp. PORK10 BA2]MEA5466487.1 hypothetical protein [Leptothoe sp. PORK10 BA2]